MKLFHNSIVLATAFVLAGSVMGKDAKKEEKAAPSTASKTVMVVIDTTMGKMEAELDREAAPLTVKNFLNYVDAKFYDGTVFHRVIKDFMVQGGGFEPGMKQKTTLDPIKNEADNGLKNLRGTLAMARTNVVDSATSQFFINHKDNGFLDHTGKNPRGWGYAVFGKVTKGLDVLDKIAAVKTGNKAGHQDVPEQDVVIKSITRK